MLSSGPEIRRLRDGAARLMPQYEPALDPEFFVASVSKGWRPRAVAVYCAGDLIGILYTKERVISGLATGVVYADGSLGGALLANKLHAKRVFQTGIEALLASPGIRGIRLRVRRDGGEIEAVERLRDSKTVSVRLLPVEHNSSPLWKYHAHLRLASTYAQFLERLGSTTRHNFRYYRKRSEASGLRFVNSLTLDELRSAAFALLPNMKFRSALHAGLEQCLNKVAASRQLLAVGLKDKDDKWVSVIGGWYRPGGAVLCFQCNNVRDLSRDSVSIVMRSYLIEKLIRQGLSELVIWADTGPPLSRYVTYVPTVSVDIDVASYPWRMARAFFSKVGPYLPKKFANAAQWVS